VALRRSARVRRRRIRGRLTAAASQAAPSAGRQHRLGRLGPRAEHQLLQRAIVASFGSADSRRSNTPPRSRRRGRNPAGQLSRRDPLLQIVDLVAASWMIFGALAFVVMLSSHSWQNLSAAFTSAAFEIVPGRAAG